MADWNGPPFGLPDPRYRVAAGLLQPRLMDSYGNRPDGSQKGRGWLGMIPRNDGGWSSELTAGVDGREIPLITPNLEYGDVVGLLNGMVPKKTLRKSVRFAEQRGLLGLSPYAE